MRTIAMIVGTTVLVAIWIIGELLEWRRVKRIISERENEIKNGSDLMPVDFYIHF